MTARPHRFVDMQASLVHALVGDVVYASTTRGAEPTRYTVTAEAGDTLYLEGSRGSKRMMVTAAAERTIWIYAGLRARRVVQAWCEEQARPVTVLEEEQEAELDRVHAMVYDLDSEVIGLRADLAAVRLENAGLHGDVDRLTVERDRLRETGRELHNENSMLEMLKDIADGDLAECRLALAQLRNIALGHVPGTMGLASNVTPASVVIEVAARLYREATHESARPIRLAPTNNYRSALETALPERMRDEATQ